jgi:hypothetical protein
MKEDNIGHRPVSRVEPEFAVATAPMALELDLQRYEGHLSEMDLTDAQKAELLSTLFSIVRSFVELGFEGDVCAAVFGSEAVDGN